MKKFGKKLMCTAAACTLAMPVTVSAGVQAQRNSDPFLVNDEWTYQMDVFTINGTNYYKLRDIVCILNGWGDPVGLKYDGAANSIYLTGGEEYKIVGTELEATGSNRYADAAVSNAKLYVDGRRVNCSAYNIKGTTYFKLRDLASALDFKVGYDAARNMVSMNIDTDFNMVDFAEKQNANQDIYDLLGGDFFFYTNSDDEAAALQALLEMMMSGDSGYHYEETYVSSKDGIKDLPNAQFDTRTKGGDIRTLLNNYPLKPQKTIYPELNALVEKFMAENFKPGMDTYTKARVAYDYFVKNMTYGSGHLSPSEMPAIDGLEYNAYVMLKKHQGVCDHYSAAYATILRYIGIDTKLVLGQTHMASGGYGGHTWVVARINGLDYVFDPQVEQNICGKGGNVTSYRFGKAYSSMPDKYTQGKYYEFQK